MGSVAIYGAGIYSIAFINALEEAGIEVEFVIDKYSTSSDYCGKDIVKPDVVKNKNIIVYVTVAHCESEIKKDLEYLGYANVIAFSDAIFQIPNIFKHFADTNILWWSKDIKLMLDKAKVDLVRKLLSNQESIELLNKITSFREHLNPDDYMFPCEETEYFPDSLGILTSNKKLRIVDGGAYTGDTIKSICALTSNIECIVSFEPDVSNIAKLKDSVVEYKKIFKDIDFAIYPMGLWSKKEILKFNIEGNASSGFSDDGKNNTTVDIPVASIDDAVFGLAPNFVKLDIEGAEIEALQGAKNTILTYKPTLAVCLYHRPSHLWEIPILINEFLPNYYDMFIKQHGHYGRELVLYCLPKKGN